MKALSWLLITLLIALILDGTTKIWAERTLDFSQPVPVIGEVFRLTLSYNTGVAFGLFANGGPWPLIITGVVILWLVIWFTGALRRGQYSPLTSWPIGLLLGGAIANFADRLLDGRVTDFLDIGFGAARWPTFNLADSFILIGIGILMLLTFYNEHKAGDSHLESSPSESEANRFLRS